MICYQNPGYPTDLTDPQWAVLQPVLVPASTRGRPRTLDLRQVINAILYVVVGGIQWRLLPHEYPHWQSVYYYFRTWRNSGQWQRIHDTLRAQLRQQADRHKHPTAGCLDSQSVKATPVVEARGYDGGKSRWPSTLPVTPACLKRYGFGAEKRCVSLSVVRACTFAPMVKNAL